MMSHTANTLPHFDATQLWEKLGEAIDRLAESWQAAGEPPPLSEFVPAGPANLRRLTLIEVIKVDLEHRWDGLRFPKLLEEYLAEFPELAAEGAIPCDLVYEEYHVRRQQGQQVSLEEYCERFPTRADELRRLLAVDTQTHSTMLVDTRKMLSFEPGQTIEDFELLAPLGRGAFASVFRARQTSMHRIVALKISRDHSLEPQTLAQLEHPNIVRVFDQRQIPAQNLRLLYMQYVPGGTLHGVFEHVRSYPAAIPTGELLLAAVDRALERNGEQPPADSLTRYKLAGASWPEVVCWMGARLAAALAHAHSLGILHRDIKPANVLIGADCQPRLADFNISCSKLDGATPAAYFGGTLAYMSPEQLEAYNPSHTRRPDEIDGRADVYSLALVLWEMLTGVRPFTDVAMPADWSLALEATTVLRREGLPATDRARVPRECPPEVVEVLLKCLDPDPDKRYAGAAELGRELELCLQPRAQSLLQARGKVRAFARRHPVSTTILIGLLPNVILSALNVVYNFSQIVTELGEEARTIFFGEQIMAVNSIAYTIGLGYIIRTRWQMFRTLQKLARGETLPEPPSYEMMRRCLRLGAATAGVSAALWTVSGFVFPTWLRFGVTETPISAPAYMHFAVSQMLCGLIAATQSYYVVTYLSLRVCFPWLLQARGPDARVLPELGHLARLGRGVLGLTVAAPFLALAALLVNDVARDVLGTIAATGFLGCVLGYWFDLAIRADLGALATAINPSGDALLSGDSVGSLLGDSRR